MSGSRHLSSADLWRGRQTHRIARTRSDEAEKVSLELAHVGDGPGADVGVAVGDRVIDILHAGAIVGVEEVLAADADVDALAFAVDLGAGEAEVEVAAAEA